MYQWRIKLYRSSQDNVLYFSEPFTKRQARQDMLLLTNHKDWVIVVRWNIIEIKRGQLWYSEDTISKRWQWSRNKTRRFLNYLETIQQIEQHKSKVKSVITIKNYDKFQGNDTTESTTERHQTIQQTDTNKNDKKEKNDKKKKTTFSPPTLDEVKDYFTSKWYAEESGERAFEYYNVAGRVDSQWKQVRNWKQKMNSVWFKEENKKKEMTMEQWRDLRDKMGIKEFTIKYWNEQAKKIMLYFL